MSGAQKRSKHNEALQKEQLLAFKEEYYIKVDGQGWQY